MGEGHLAKQTCLSPTTSRLGKQGWRQTLVTVAPGEEPEAGYRLPANGEVAGSRTETLP